MIGNSLVAQLVKNMPAVQETWINPWIGKIPWGRKWQPLHYSCWKIQRTEEHGRLQSMGSQELETTYKRNQHSSLTML